MKRYLLLALAATAPLMGAEPELIKGINEFSVDFYKAVMSQEGNLVVSPFNLSTSLSMAYVGAAEETAEQMAKVLHYPAGPSYQELAQNFASLAHHLEGEKAYQLSLANGTWIQANEPVLHQYESILATDFGSDLQRVDFAASAAAVDKINKWVASHTSGKIEQLLESNSVNKNTRLVLVSALYFRGAWHKAFEPKKTEAAPFRLGAGKTLPSQMMEGRFHYPYMKGSDFSLGVLPYKSDKEGAHWAMLIFLPDAVDGLPALEQKLSYEMLVGAMHQLQLKEMKIRLPKFETTTRVYAADTLKSMGMEKAFTPAANFSGINGKQDMMLNAVVQEAFINVDEAGTEAAAATAATVGVTSFLPEKAEVDFIADHPFFYVLLDVRSGQFLLMGRMEKPSL